MGQYVDRRRAICNIVIPSQLPSSPRLAPAFAPSLRYLQKRAEIFAPRGTEIWAVDIDRRLLYRMNDGRFIRKGDLKGSVVRAIVNPAFVLLDIPPFDEMVRLNKLADAYVEAAHQPRLCGFLWRQGSIGSTHKGNRASAASNYMYPCIGPLSSADLSGLTPFTFPGEADFLKLWRNPVFAHLRSAQKRKGLCTVCDKCRSSDSRDAAHFPDFERLVADFTNDIYASPLTGGETPETR